MLAGTMVVLWRGMCGGVAKVPPHLEGLAQVLEWRQVKQYARPTHFVWLRWMQLAPNNPKKEAGKGTWPCHKVWIVRTNPNSN